LIGEDAQVGVSDFKETEEKLKIRIRAHTDYANFALEDWIGNWLGEVQGQCLLEVGCGDGNFFEAYSSRLGQQGLIIGMDKGKDLLHKAREKTASLRTSSVLIPWDYDDHPWPILDEQADVSTAPYSAYYTADAEAWVEEALRVTRKGGRLLLLGPTEENARELYALNEIVSGTKTVPETDEVTDKLERAFFPALEERLGERASKTILDRRILFPTPVEFARYYLATMLYDRTASRLNREVSLDEATEAAGRTSLELNKQIVCIEAVKI
jgi:ubiquinone/menaquinone biosynthesis C-methylase UbiE